jgi:CheY-like chemotaxis protein
VAGERILIVEHDPEMAQLLSTVLDSTGHETEWLLRGEVTLAEVRQRSPDLLLVDLLPGQRDGYDLLDQLRSDAGTSPIPVVAMTTDRSLGEGALASYNVRAALTKPIDMADLMDAVQHALNMPPLPAVSAVAHPTDGLLMEAERILAEHSREALFRWVQRLQLESPWKGRRDLGLRELLDSVPILVEALTAGLRHGDPHEFFERNPDLIDRVRSHALTRRGQGIPLAAVVREYTLLRREIWRLFRRYLPEQLATEDVLVLEEAANLSLDRIIEATIPAYLEG